MDLIALPAFADNLIWMLHDGENAIVVDPGVAAPVKNALHERGLRLVTFSRAGYGGSTRAAGRAVVDVVDVGRFG